jgi:hypothetical protein
VAETRVRVVGGLASGAGPKPRAPPVLTTLAAPAQFLLNRFQPLSESAIYGTRLSCRDASRGDPVSILH